MFDRAKQESLRVSKLSTLINSLRNLQALYFQKMRRILSNGTGSFDTIEFSSRASVKNAFRSSAQFSIDSVFDDAEIAVPSG